MRHIAAISRQPAAAQTNFQVLLDGMLAIMGSLFGGFGTLLGGIELTQRQRVFKTGGGGLEGDPGNGNGGDIGEGFF